jgi:hypothetical protein
VIDSSSDFDARRIGWWARRTAVRQIRRSTAITDADRALRVQQAGAAQTRGELNALTRGLSAAGPAAAPWTPPRPSDVPLPKPYAPQRPPAARPPQAGRPPSSWTPPGQQVPVPQPFAQQPPARTSSKRGSVLVGLVIVLLMCGGGLVSCVSSVVDTVRSSSSVSPGPSVSTPDLRTEQGWSEMVDAFGTETDLAESLSLLVRDRSATLSVAVDDSSSDGYRYDGDVTPTGGVDRVPSEQVFDLRDIEPSVPVGAVARAREGAGEPESTEAWLQVWSAEAGPRILVAFPSGTADTYTLVVDSAGAVLDERF